MKRMLAIAAVLATVGLTPSKDNLTVRDAAAAPAAKPLRIAFSDWPGWTAFEVGIQKGWFKEAGVDVEFDWFEYAPSMEAFAAGKVDAVMMTMGDALVTGAPGARSVAILVTDYSNGNDMIVAKQGINEHQGPQGQEDRPRDRPGRAPAARQGAGEERAEDRRRQAGQRPDRTRRRRRWRPGDVDAIGAWQPNAGQALKAVAGLEGDLHQRRRAGPHLRPGLRQPAEPGRRGAPTG